jgi:diketogulonate reductase-like aldo/keto reductase
VNFHRKKVAVTEGLNPARLLPHSLRVFSVNQIESHGLHAQQVHGRWNTSEGMSVYTHAALAHAHRVSPELHNVDILPAEFLRFCVYDT